MWMIWKSRKTKKVRTAQKGYTAAKAESYDFSLVKTS